MPEEPTKNLYVIRLCESVLNHRRFKKRNSHYQPDSGKPCVYVGQTGLDPEERFRNHKEGHKASRIARKYGVHLMKKRYEHLNPVPASEAVEREEALAIRLRDKRGYAVWWG